MIVPPSPANVTPLMLVALHQQCHASVRWLSLSRAIPPSARRVERLRVQCDARMLSAYADHLIMPRSEQDNKIHILALRM